MVTVGCSTEHTLREGARTRRRALLWGRAYGEYAVRSELKRIRGFAF